MFLLVAVPLAACSTTESNVPQEARIVQARDALIIPPPGGPAIVNVVSTTLPNAIRQDIWLETNARTAGENKITVLRFTGEGGDGSDANARDIPFTNVNLTEEALKAWPGSGMSVSPYFVQNNYGPFGYAIGKPANGDTCIYAWQRVAPGLRPSGAVRRGAIAIRLQLCRRNSSEQQLLDIMYRFRINADVFPAQGAPPLIGRIAAPIRPVGAEGFADVIPQARPVAVQSTQTTTRTTTQTVVTTTPVITPPVGAPIVPSPTGGVRNNTSGVIVPRPTATTVPNPTSTQ